MGTPSAEAAIALRLLEEADDLLQLGLGLVDAGDIREGHLGIGFDIDLGLAAPDGHEAAHALLLGDAAEDEHPEAKEEQDRQDPGEDVPEQGILQHPTVADVILLQLGREAGIDAIGDEAPLLGWGARLLRGGRLQGSGDGIGRNHDVLDLPGFEQLLELAIGNLLGLLTLGPQPLQQEHADEGGHHIPEVEFELLVHGTTLSAMPAAQFAFPKPWSAR